MLMILVDGAILKGLVVDAIDDRNCHRGVVPAGRRRKKLELYWFKQDDPVMFTCKWVQAGEGASSC